MYEYDSDDEKKFKDFRKKQQEIDRQQDQKTNNTTKRQLNRPNKTTSQISNATPTPLLPQPESDEGGETK